jgi:hypothetical protein
MDLPVWQALYAELAPRNFVVITVAMDTGGASDASQWIEQAAPTHPSLIDVHHHVAELYDWVNVPSIAWIDEAGRIVRPNDPGFAGEYFRGMMEPDFDFQKMMAEHHAHQERYLAAVRDWVERGPASPYALTAEQLRTRLAGPNPDHARAAAYFRLGTFLQEHAQPDAAQAAFARAKELRPESWNYKRQAWHLEEPGKSGGAEFWAEVKALGDRPYYPRTEL